MLSVISTIILLFIFFSSGIFKFLNFKNTTKGFKKMFLFKKLPNFFYSLIIGLVIILEIVGPLVIVYNKLTGKLTDVSYYSTLSLVIFTILATIMYHSPTKKGQYYYFMKNTSIIGGLLLLLSTI